ncbi:N-acetylglucosamine-6-phosphate deacetylase [Sphingobacterium faecale]|uniref:N-acetylglucosamine-6-phosphate deacetylase n=1 Tax=Sphingobacterium faecale TaxID=2803775 RepID=A0ABS1QYG3_9SPHI|nr:N-acetylglucosamine-6-phosphate deacetylase [Sphingobacterium faecale]MBL1407472.1 N-acetylglucosamine-6-phosphate deacetylase [Sphingobacterium faecale]
MLTIVNAQVIRSNEIIDRGWVSIKDGRIVAIGDYKTLPKEGLQGEIIDAQGLYLSPGFVDIHVHGGGGADFMDNELEAYLTIAETHAKFGTTAMFPTTLTSEPELLWETFSVYEQSLSVNQSGAKFYGLHLEGPYFSMNQRGAQDPRFIRNPDASEYRSIIQKYSRLIARWSAAPELPGALEFGDYVSEAGIVLALGHTDAVYEDIVRGIEHGYRLATHLYSGMSGMTRKNAFRYAGAIESCLLLEDIDVEIIADGVHLPEPFLKLICKNKRKDQIVLITDAMRGAGTSDRESILGSKQNGTPVIIEDGVAKLPDLTSFAGSVATADRLIRTMINVAEIPLIDAVQMLSLNPARIMRIDDQTGSIEKGKLADLILFNERIEVKTTIVNGNIVYEA